MNIISILNKSNWNIPIISFFKYAYFCLWHAIWRKSIIRPWNTKPIIINKIKIVLIKTNYSTPWNFFIASAKKYISWFPIWNKIIIVRNNFVSATGFPYCLLCFCVRTNNTNCAQLIVCCEYRIVLLFTQNSLYWVCFFLCHFNILIENSVCAFNTNSIISV